MISNMLLIVSKKLLKGSILPACFGAQCTGLAPLSSLSRLHPLYESMNVLADSGCKDRIVIINLREWFIYIHFSLGNGIVHHKHLVRTAVVAFRTNETAVTIAWLRKAVCFNIMGLCFKIACKLHIDAFGFRYHHAGITDWQRFQ
jgi:hypothetical protein